MNKKSVTIINLLLIAVLCVSLTSCGGNQAVRYVVVTSAEEIPEPPAEEPEPQDNILLTLTHKDSNSLIPINDFTEWDGWIAGVWEQRPDGTRTRKSPFYLNFPERHHWDHWIYSVATSVLKYDISGIEPTHFGAYFALVNPACGGAASMQILAFSDRKHIYQSKVLRLQDSGTYIEFDIPKGTEILIIEVNEVENRLCDHFVFGEPTLFAGTSTTTK